MRGVRAAIGVVGELLLTAGLFFLLFVVWQLGWSSMLEASDQRGTADRLAAEFATGGKGAVDPNGLPPGLLDGTAFAIVHIPRFGADFSRPVLEGTGVDTLAKGLGHFKGSVGPGIVGNFALAGHRATHGEPLARIDELKIGDPLVAETLQGWYVYRITSSRIVAPTQVSVTYPVPDQPGTAPTEPLITLVSCNPRWGHTGRFVVAGPLEHFYPRAGGLPPEATTLAAGGN